jgi:hypothetical protein
MAALDKAADRTVSSWNSTRYGRTLVKANQVPAVPQEDLRKRIETEVLAWQASVLELVRAQGASKRAAGRFVSLGVNGVGAALMIAVFAHTGGLTGGEVVIAGGTAALSQRLLEALFGDEAVRDLTSKARTDLLDRIQGLIEKDTLRYEEAARRGANDPEDLSSLRDALGALEANPQ